MNKTLPVCYIEVKELGKRKFEHIATMVSDISYVMNYVKDVRQKLCISNHFDLRR